MSTEYTPTFTLFSQLPTELRLQIWETALSGWCISKYAIQGPRYTRLRWHALGPDNAAIGQSCHEARELIKKTYVQVVHLNRIHRLSKSHPIDWINFNRHIFYTEGAPLSSQVLTLTRAPWRQRIQHVVISTRHIDPLSWGLFPAILEIAHGCASIQTILVLQKCPGGLQRQMCNESDIAKTIEISSQGGRITQISEGILQDLVYHRFPLTDALGKPRPNILLRAH
ncbi:hypothetical protein F5X99DRAFT_388513 [Biscogniauxia marginata]|nr:hypothetical protein F5X99DRAFT_388513 [Biscogniauxia marginata]